jgi:transcriptional regulator with XRE-family HTH domain
MTPSPPWPAELTRHTGRQVRKFRDQAGMSAEQLAEAVTKAGLPYTRSQVTNLEANRRTTITVGEVVVLGRVLKQPPLLLIFPLDDVEEIEVLPEHRVEAWAAVKWFTGDAGFPGEDPMTWTLVRELREHDQALLELRNEQLILERQTVEEQRLRRSMTAIIGGYERDLDLVDVDPDKLEDPAVRRAWVSWRTLAAELPAGRGRVRRLEQDVIMRRRRLRKRGVVPPPLDAEFADLDADETETGE